MALVLTVVINSRDDHKYVCLLTLHHVLFRSLSNKDYRLDTITFIKLLSFHPDNHQNSWECLRLYLSALLRNFHPHKSHQRHTILGLSPDQDLHTSLYPVSSWLHFGMLPKYLHWFVPVPVETVVCGGA